MRFLDTFFLLHTIPSVVTATDVTRPLRQTGRVLSFMDHNQTQMMKRLISSTVFGLVLLLLPGIAWAQQGTVRGTVTDAQNGEALPGANVVVQGENIGSATQSEGQYVIRGVPAGQQTLTVSFVGYEQSERTVDVPAGGTVRVNFELEPDFAAMDEVVVVGFGEQQRERITGSVTSIDAAQIESQAVGSSVEELLQGTSGVQVTATSGLAGQSVNVTIRGASTISGGTQPLYVVDGTPITSGGGTGGAFGGSTTPLSTLNQNDIASIEVLKGASATAIYGSRAANGVVLIETKQGSSTGDLQVSASFEAGTVNRTEKFEDKIANGPEFVAITNDLIANEFGLPEEEGAGQAVFGSAIPASPEDAESFGWVDEVQRTGVSRSGNLSVSGGDNDTQFFLSGNWEVTETFVIENRFDRFSGRLNITQDVKDWLRMGANTSITRTQNFQVGSDNLFAAPLTSAALQQPIVPIRNEDGSPNLDNTPLGGNTFHAPFVARRNQNTIRNWRVLSTPFIEATPLQSLIQGDLTLRMEGGIDVLSVIDDDRANRLEGDGTPDGSAFRGAEEERRFSIRGTATYDRTFANRHDINLLLGTSHEDSRRKGTFANVVGLPSFDFKQVASGATPTITSGNLTRQNGITSFFTRLSYTLDNKYTVEGSFRRDASSRFSDENEWGNFGSASFAYNVHREDFMQDIGWLSNLKLRGSFGFTGNNQIGAFFGSRNLFAGGADINERAGIAPSQLGDEDLQWESKRTIEGGVDLGLLNDRIFLNTTYYTSNTDQLILPRQLAPSNGFTALTQNAGEIRTQGVELSLETENILTDNIRWSTTINASWQDEKVKDLVTDSPIISGLQRAVEGESITFNMPIFEGVDPEDGEALFRDADGGTTKNPTTADNFNVGDVLPSWTGSVTNSFNYSQPWGSIDMRARFNFRLGNDVFNSTRQFLGETASGVFNMPKSFQDAWQEPGDQADLPRLTFFDSAANYQTSTLFLEDGGFVRLKSISLGYTLPDGLTNQFGIDQLRLYFQGTNLWTYDQITFGDAEASSGGATNILNRGVVFFTPPQQKRFTGGLELQF